MEALFQADAGRMDWGLGNPNKTAALIACLLIVVWAPARHGPRGFWIAFVLWVALAFCLARTGSRGGIVAAACGQAILLLFAARRVLTPARAAALCAAVLAVALWDARGASGAGTGGRFRQVFEGDRSVVNRLVIWGKVPAMVRDAPGGWGAGRAGWAYTQWYQPEATRLEYRTLVNSHLTFLVERGWPGRLLYCVVLAGVAWLCWPGWPGRTSSPGPLACWVALGVSASFSSVLESWALWPIPLAMLGVALGDRVRTGRQLGIAGAAVTVGVGGLCAAVLFALGLVIGGGPEQIRGSRGSVTIGPHTARRCAVVAHPDPAVLGTHYGLDIRRGCTRAAAADDISWRIVFAGDEAASRAAPVEADVLVFSGKIELETVRILEWVRPRAIVLLNPSDDGWIERRDFCGRSIPVVVVIGLRRTDATAAGIVRFAQGQGWDIVPVKGAARYLSGWIEVMIETMERLRTR